MAMRRDGGMGLGEAALKGALASVVGGLAMKLVWEAEERALLDAPERLGSPTKQAVTAMAARRGRTLSDRQTTLAATALYLGSMAQWGALYGIVQNRLQPPHQLHGLVLGALVYAANFPGFGVLPKLDVYLPPSGQSKAQAAIPIGAHVAYGITTAAAYRALA